MRMGYEETKRHAGNYFHRTLISILMLLPILTALAGTSIQGAERPAKRLIDIAPEDAFLAVSVTDVQGFLKDLSESTFWKLRIDPAYAPLFDSIRDFYVREGYADNPDMNNLREALDMFQLTPQEIGSIFQGEATFVVWDVPFLNGRVVPDVALAIDAKANVATLQKIIGVFHGFAAGMLMMQDIQISSHVVDGVTIYNLTTPNFKKFDVSISWAVAGTRLILADRDALLQSILSDLEPGTTTPHTFLTSDIGKSISAALSGNADVIARLNVAKLLAVRDVIKQPKARRFLEAVSASQLRDIVLGWGVDKSGNIRETCLFRLAGGAPTYLKPLPPGGVSAPNGAFARVALNADFSAMFATLTDALVASGAPGKRVLQVIHAVETHQNFSFEKDIFAAVSGPVNAYAAMRFNSGNMVTHFIPDAIVSVPVNGDFYNRVLLKLVSKRGRNNPDVKAWRAIGQADLPGIYLGADSPARFPLEPTIIIKDGRLIFNYLNRSGVRRATRKKLPGPPPVTLDGTGLKQLITADTGLVAAADASALIPFAYNMIDFLQHTDWRRAALNFRTLPPADNLDKYLGAVAVIGTQSDGVVQFTVSSPMGVSTGIAGTALLWRYLSVNTKKRKKLDLEKLRTPKQQKHAIPDIPVNEPDDDRF